LRVKNDSQKTLETNKEKLQGSRNSFWHTIGTKSLILIRLGDLGGALGSLWGAIGGGRRGDLGGFRPVFTFQKQFSKDTEKKRTKATGIANVILAYSCNEVVDFESLGGLWGCPREPSGDLGAPPGAWGPFCTLGDLRRLGGRCGRPWEGIGLLCPVFYVTKTLPNKSKKIVE
jgi:hypothetical protein